MSWNNPMRPSDEDLDPMGAAIHTGEAILEEIRTMLRWRGVELAESEIDGILRMKGTLAEILDLITKQLTGQLGQLIAQRMSRVA